MDKVIGEMKIFGTLLWYNSGFNGVFFKAYGFRSETLTEIVKRGIALRGEIEIPLVNKSYIFFIFKRRKKMIEFIKYLSKYMKKYTKKFIRESKTVLGMTDEDWDEIYQNIAIEILSEGASQQ